MAKNDKSRTESKSRRNLLKATIAGSGALIAGKTLPEEWKRPLVEAVSLPAHAQTSITSFGGAVMGTSDYVDNRDWLDFLVPTAMAGVPEAPGLPAPEPSVIDGLVCVQNNGNGTVNVQGYFVYGGTSPQYPYFTGMNVPVGVTTPLVLQNGPCLSATMTGTVVVQLVGGAATGTFILNENHEGPDTSGQVDFNLTEPGCPIVLGDIVGCDYAD